jgi:flavin reductase (DIM6/NTAB) family NADH-FMN oxidoreductase RutF
MDDNRINDRFSGIDHYGARGVPPALDAATVFSCKTEQLVASGSHLVVIGRVTAVRAGDPAPLTYLDGGYHALVPAHSEHNHLTQTTV